MASTQTRLGSNIAGYYSLLQASAKALNLLLKECVFPTQANLISFLNRVYVTIQGYIFNVSVQNILPLYFAVQSCIVCVMLFKILDLALGEFLYSTGDGTGGAGSSGGNGYSSSGNNASAGGKGKNDDYNDT